MALSPAVCFSLFYWLVSFCFIVSPTEFQTAGVTIQRIFRSRLGSENIQFVEYHIRRTAITVIFHAALPLGYFIAMTFVEGAGLELFEFREWPIHILWQIYFYFSTSVFLGSITLVYFWRQNNWSNHPIARKLAVYAADWRSESLRINAEFRNIDKFTSGPGGTLRAVVTDNWIIKSTAYNVSLVRQDFARLSVGKTEEYHVSPDTRTSVQFVRINVHSLKNQSTFGIRIRSTEYGDFKAKLSTPVYTLPNITIHQSASELFLEAFREQVFKNPIHLTNMLHDAGNCIGCDQKPVEVNIVKQCANRDDGECENCACAPLWCLDCMGRWYASRQDPQRPESWLGGFATCPMCRARFCMLDVSRLEQS